MKIRKIFSLVLVALLVAGVALAATPGFRLSPGIGENKTHAQGGQQSDPGKTFRIVRYVPADGDGDSTTLVTESLMVWDVISDDGVTVTTSTTSYISTVAGIIVQAALTPETLGNTAVEDRGKRNWTWLQTHGLAQVRVGNGSVAVSEAMGTSVNAGEAGTFLASASDGTLNGNAGFFYDAANADADDVEVFIMCE